MMQIEMACSRKKLTQKLFFYIRTVMPLKIDHKRKKRIFVNYFKWMLLGLPLAIT